MTFESGTFHENRRGVYIVVSVSGPNASIRYQDGIVAEAEVAVLQRIEESILSERAFGEKPPMQFDEACRYLAGEGIPFNSEDAFGVFLTANEHKQRRRLVELQVELHRSFLAKRGLPTGGRSLVVGAADIQKAHRYASCYNCYISELDNSVHLECSACGWIMCPKCGACGCGYQR